MREPAAHGPGRLAKLIAAAGNYWHSINSINSPHAPFQGHPKEAVKGAHPTVTPWRAP